MKKYTPTLHAIERLKMRLGIDAAQAAEWFTQAMHHAKYVVTQNHNGKSQLIYEYSGLYIVVGSDSAIITIKPAASSTASPISEKVSALVRREIRKAETASKRLQRRYDIEIAELGVELAQMALNKARARSPKVRAAIDVKMNEINALIDGLNTQKEREADRLENMRRGAELYGATQ